MYILDACAFIWTIQNSSKLSPKVVDILAGDDAVYVSKATLIDEGYTLLTNDTNICKYNEVKCLW